MPQECCRAVLCLFLGGENGMFSHIMVGSNDIARSKKFYDALFVAMGGSPATPDARGRLAYAHNGGVANGGTTIEDPPGVRQGAAGQMYLAYLRDPDGNKVVAVHRMPAA